MKKYLVIGNPIQHSLSPVIHNYWMNKYNIDAIIDDTDDNYSSKLKKMNLIGTPYQIVIGKNVDGDLLEFKETGKETQKLSLNKIIEIITKQKVLNWFLI